MDAEVAAYIGRWRPVSVSPAAAALARLVTQRAAPSGRKRANALLHAAARLAEFAVSLGLELAPEVVFHPSVIERFARAAPGLSGSGAPHAAYQPAVHRAPGGAAAAPAGCGAAAGARQEAV